MFGLWYRCLGVAKRGLLSLKEHNAPCHSDSFSIKHVLIHILMHRCKAQLVPIQETNETTVGLHMIAIAAVSPIHAPL